MPVTIETKAAKSDNLGITREGMHKAYGTAAYDTKLVKDYTSDNPTVLSHCHHNGVFFTVLDIVPTDTIQVTVHGNEQQAAQIDQLVRKEIEHFDTEVV